MTINFIGQGLSTEKNTKTVGNYLFSSFKDDHFNKFTGFSAYATSAGLRNLNSALKQAKSTYKEIKFVIGIDDNITTKEVFEGLLNLGIECYTVHTPKDTTFHPKIYIFEGDRKNRIILGSANMTTNGLYDINIEASVVVEFFVDDIRGHKFLNQIKDYFKTIFNGENKNAVRIDFQSLEMLNLKSDKDKRQIENENASKDDSINKDNLEKNKKFTNEKDLGGIPSQEKHIDYSKNREYDKTILTPHYLATWHLHFEALKNYQAKKGDTAIPSDFDDIQLVEWIRRQKFLKNNKLIPKEHEEALNSINFYWKTLVDWNSEKVWEENFEKFKEYYLKL